MTAVPLSGQVVMGPLNFDVPVDWVGLQYDLDSDKLDQTLVKLSQTIAKNAKVTNNMKDEISALRAHIDNSVSKLQRTLQVLDDSGRAAKEQVMRVYDEVKALQGASVRRQEYDVDKDIMWKEIRSLTAFVDDYKATEGHMDKMQGWVRNFVPEWYAQVSAGVDRQMRAAIMQSREETKEALAAELSTVHTRAVEAAKNASAVMESRFESVDAKLRSYEERLADLDSRQTRQLSMTSAVSAGYDELKDHLRQLATDFASGQQVQDSQLDAALTLLGITPANLQEFVAVQETPIAGGNDSTTLIPGLPPVVPSTEARRRQSSPLAAIGAPLPQLAPAGRIGARRVDSTDDADPHSRRASTSALSAVTPTLSVDGGHLTAAGPGHIAMKLKDPDAAAAFVASLPAFKIAAQQATSDARRVAEELSTKSRELIQQVTKEVQGQLADKVGLSKLKELIDKHRDDKLYWTVDSLAKDMATLRDTKIDANRFDSALSSKADKSSLDGKAEKLYVDTAINHATSKAEVATTEVEMLKVQLRESVTALNIVKQQLAAMAAGGGGGAASGGGHAMGHGGHEQHQAHFAGSGSVQRRGPGGPPHDGGAQVGHQQGSGWGASGTGNWSNVGPAGADVSGSGSSPRYRGGPPGESPRSQQLRGPGAHQGGGGSGGGGGGAQWGGDGQHMSSGNGRGGDPNFSLPALQAMSGDGRGYHGGAAAGGDGRGYQGAGGGGGSEATHRDDIDFDSGGGDGGGVQGSGGGGRIGRPPRQRGNRGRGGVQSGRGGAAAGSGQLPTPPDIPEMGLGDVLHRLTQEEFVYGHQHGDPRLAPPRRQTSATRPATQGGRDVGAVEDGVATTTTVGAGAGRGYSAPPA